jgi:4-aminobutyrate aminotransferase
LLQGRSLGHRREVQGVQSGERPLAQAAASTRCCGSTTRTRPSTLSETLPSSLDGYDFDAETRRARELLPDVTIAGHTLHRATAKVSVAADPAEWEKVRERHRREVLPNTLDPDSPVVELGWPTSGHYAMSSRGVEIDLMLGVAQKIVDERHPTIVRDVERLAELGLLVRREIATDDYLRAAPHCSGVHTTADLAALLNRAAGQAYPSSGPWKSFFTNSGTEAIEACMKLAYEVKYKRFLEKHGAAVLARVMAELGIREFAPLAADASFAEAVYEDYPFFVVGCNDAFHGRTLGALAITASKKAQKLGYPRSRWIRHVPLNAPAGTLASLVDARPLTEVLATPGELRRTIDAGKVPADLFAGFVVEPFQGEGGYVPATPEFLADCHAACRRADALFLLDEVQTFGRTGTIFYGEQLGVVPDAFGAAKGLFVGAMVARADLTKYLHVGWHSNTWGGGKVFDVQVAHAVLDVLMNDRGPLFESRTPPENLRVKAKLIEAALVDLRARHPATVVSHVVRGGLARLSVRRRPDVVRAAHLRGAKLLGCGRMAEVASIRLVFLADVLAKEIRDAFDVIDLALTDVESS